MINTSSIENVFAANFAERGELGAAFCVWSDAGAVVSLAGGVTSRDLAAAPWTEHTLVPVWSTTKGPAAATLLWALDRARLSLDTPVSHVWPALGADATFGQLLSHQAGLPAPGWPKARGRGP